MSRVPIISRKHRVCVICEGMEELVYFKRLLELNVWSTVYEFIPINAQGESRIFARFQDAYNNDNYELVIVFCDTDKKPHKEYLNVKKRINDFFDKRNAARKLILWANPCSMQLILSHFGDIHLVNQGKKTNAGIIENMTGVKNYNGHETQIKEICGKIFRRSYPEMKERLTEQEYDEEKAGSSNAVLFFDRFEGDDIGWIDNIRKTLNC